MEKPNWPEISRLANELSSATAGLRESLIKNNYEVGLLLPIEIQCTDLGLALNNVLEQPPGAVDDEMTITVRNAYDVVYEFRGQLTILIEIADSLAGRPRIKDRLELEDNWFKRARKVTAASRGTDKSLRGLIEIIGLRAHEQGGDAQLDTAI